MLNKLRRFCRFDYAATFTHPLYWPVLALTIALGLWLMRLVCE